jgi:hypothetical protein
MLRFGFFFTAAVSALLIISGCESGEPATALANAEPVTLNSSNTYAAGMGGRGGGGSAQSFRNLAANSADGANPVTPAMLTVSPDATTQPVAVAARMIVYSGALTVVVTDVADTLESIRQLAISGGGYMDEQTANAITVRVPAAKFDQTVAAVAKMGEVTSRQIKAADITEEMRDLDIRLANAEQTRQKLLEILANAQNVDDALKVETQLERVTETVELLKGKIRYMQTQVDYSTLRVELNSPLPQNQMVAVIPFPWVRDLGQGLVSGAAETHTEKGGWFSGGVGIDMPAGYIRYYQLDDLTEGMSANGVMIKAQRHDNYAGGDITFWSELAHRALVENRSVAISGQTDFQLHDHTPAKIIDGTKEISDGKFRYLLLVAVSNDNVYTVEMWGPKDLVDKDHDALQKSLASLDAH